MKNPDLNNYTSGYCYEHFRICSLHFENNMFSSIQGNRLKRDAVPTIFEVDSVLYEEQRKSSDEDSSENVPDTGMYFIFLLQ